MRRAAPTRQRRAAGSSSLDEAAVRQLLAVEVQQRSDADAREAAEHARNRAEAEARAAKEQAQQALLHLVQEQAARQAAEQALADAEQDAATLGERARRDEQRAARLATRLGNLQREQTQAQRAQQATEGARCRTPLPCQVHRAQTMP